jgi:toxin CcdB
MAQWDVFVNPSVRARAELPYLVDVQSDLLGGVATRLVVPLAIPGAAPMVLPKRMSPEFDIASRRVMLLPHEAGPVYASVLREPVASLRDQAHRIVDALDTVISGV